jgi:hypothetical protein
MRQTSFDCYTKLVLTAIALFLGIAALRPIVFPDAARAQQQDRDLYIEPGYTMLRKPDGMSQVKGKVVIDRRTGDIWGFPTTVDGPYPVDTARTTPPVSTPMYLGKFDFSAIKAQ